MGREYGVVSGGAAEVGRQQLGRKQSGGVDKDSGPEKLRALKDELEMLCQDTAQIQQRRSDFRQQSRKIALQADPHNRSAPSLSQPTYYASEGNPRLADRRLSNFASSHSLFNTDAPTRLAVHESSDGFQIESHEGNDLVLQAQHPLGGSATSLITSSAGRERVVASAQAAAGNVRASGGDASHYRMASRGRPSQEVLIHCRTPTSLLRSALSFPLFSPTPPL